MHSLTDWKTRFPKIPQKAGFWCIPASIENMLRYRGVTSISQEDLILGYCQKFGDNALLRIVSSNPLRAVPVPIKGLADAEIIQLARQCAFQHGNFETFAEPARKSAAFLNAKLSLDFTGSIKTKADYFAIITAAVKADCPVLISVNNGNGTFHIQSVVEVETDKFLAYDPALNKIEKYNLANCIFSDDVLVLKPTP
jgi:hypothetical protein